MPSFGAPALCGYLEEDSFNELASGRYEILDGQELMIGRDLKTCDIVLTDPTISNQHLQIYNIVYAEDNHERIFTYAKDLSTNGSFWRYRFGNQWKELLIGKGKAVLLSDGDRLFMNLFRIRDQKLGSGAYGEVWMAVDTLHQRQMACKVVKLNRSPGNRSGKAGFSAKFWREVDLLKDISHPNILHVERVFFTKERLYIISDLVTGGDLMSYIERPWTKICDAEACIIVFQVLKALECLHRQGICHRDLKPENILMSTPAAGARVILADFGHSIRLSGGKQACSRRMKTASVGTDYYVAPEVRGNKKNTGGYTMAMDMWSIGIISALLLTGESVSENSMHEYNSPAAVPNAAAECDLARMVYSPLWQSVNVLAKDFVRNLLLLDEKARLNVETALEHGWFTDSKRKEDIHQEYEDAIRGWIPSRPLLDFKEDLAMFQEASRSTLDSILMPPPAKPRAKGFLRRSLHRSENGQRSSPFFLRAIQDGATELTPQAAKKRELEFGDEADKPSILPKQAMSTNERQSKGRPENINVRCKAKKPAKSSAMQIAGLEHEDSSHAEPNQRPPQSSLDLDYEERRLYDRASREEASIFRSAKSYGESITKRRKLGD